MRSLFFVLIIGILPNKLSGQKMISREGGHCFSLSVPDYMVKTYKLNNVASLQYQNIRREAYVIVIEDPKEQLDEIGMHFTGPEDFISGFLKEYKGDAAERSVSSISTFDARSNRLAQATINWTEDENQFHMLVTAVETRTHYYKILCWSVNDHWEELKDDFEKIASSLKD